MIKVVEVTHIKLNTTRNMAYTNNRSEGIINLTEMGVSNDKLGEVASMLIGKGGSGIRRYTGQASGSFVKLYNSSGFCAKEQNFNAQASQQY